jgi:signal peptidase I
VNEVPGGDPRDPEPPERSERRARSDPSGRLGPLEADDAALPASARELRRARAAAREISRHLAEQRRRLADDKRRRLEQALTELEGLTEGVPSRGILEAARRRAERVADDVLEDAPKGPLRETLEAMAVALVVAGVLRLFVLEAFRIPSGSMIPTLEVGDRIFMSKLSYGVRLPLVGSWIARWAAPARGEVVVFRYPRDETKDYIKRVVAIAGDHVRVEGREVRVNGRALPREAPEPYTYVDEAEEQATRGDSVDVVAYRERPAGADAPRYVVLYRTGEVDRLPFPASTARTWPGLRCETPSDGAAADCEVLPGHVFAMGDNRDNSSDGRTFGAVPIDHVKGKAIVVWWSSVEGLGVRWARLGTWIHADR